MNRLADWFHNHKHKMKCYKWIHYFDIYEKHFSRFVDKKKVRVLEIGVMGGGSLEMWDYYFKDSEIVGLDINPACLDLQKNFGDNVKIELGDQSNPHFWEEFKKNNEPFDIIIDDGGHRMNQQQLTFDMMYDHVTENGVFLVEDTHTSYFTNFGGQMKGERTFIEKSKDLIDSLHINHFKKDTLEVGSKERLEFQKKTASISFYDSVVVFEKRPQTFPYSQRK